MKSLSLLCFAIFLFTFFSFGQAPHTNLTVPGLKNEVTVRRDTRGIPYIEAKNDADLYFAQGYATATDRLWQMDLLRRVARGETAEIFGRVTLEEDKRWRRFDFARIAEENLKFLSHDLVAAIDNYARGVNAYIAGLDDETLPVEFKILKYKPRQWRSSDTVIIGKILADGLSTTWRNDLLRASLQNIPQDKLADLTNQVTPYDVVLFGRDRRTTVTASNHPNEGPAATASILALADLEAAVRQRSLERIGFYAEDLAASNNWVIAGKRTADGKPILANDPHLPPTVPGIWYLAHLSTPAMRVSGVTFPGVPAIILGHNEHIAWGATNVGPDVQDLYVETFNEKGEYKTPAGWKPAPVRRETMRVRTSQLFNNHETIQFDVTETRNGPIVLEADGKRYALKWTAFDPKNTEFEAFYRWNRARNWAEFKAALRSYGGPAQNFVYADTKGNIGWYAASRIPIRRTGDGAMPYDGSTNEGDWIGFIPFAELPNLYNPRSGLIVTANQRIVGTSYRYKQISRDAAPPWRARRIQDELESRKKITMDDVSEVQHDSINIPLVNLAKAIVKLGAASPQTQTVVAAWDGRMTPDSRAALLVNEIRVCAAEKMAAANKPVPAVVIRERALDKAVSEQLSRWLPNGFTSYADLLRSCDSDVRKDLAGRFGSNESKWTWGRVWTTRFEHPLAGAFLVGSQFKIPARPLSGSGQTPNVGSGVSMRHIASPGNWDATRHVIPLGQSGDPKSAQYHDQLDAWAAGTPAVFPFTREAVEKAAVSTIVLVPRP